MNEFVAMAIKEMAAQHGKPKEKIASGKTKDGHDYFINEYPATKTNRDRDLSGSDSEGQHVSDEGPGPSRRPFPP